MIKSPLTALPLLVSYWLGWSEFYCDCDLGFNEYRAHYRSLVAGHTHTSTEVQRAPVLWIPIVQRLIFDPGLLLWFTEHWTFTSGHALMRSTLAV